MKEQFESNENGRTPRNRRRPGKLRLFDLTERKSTPWRKEGEESSEDEEEEGEEEEEEGLTVGCDVRRSTPICSEVYRTSI